MNVSLRTVPPLVVMLDLSNRSSRLSPKEPHKSPGQLKVCLLRLRIAEITQAIVIRILLRRIGHGVAIINVVWNPIAIGISRHHGTCINIRLHGISQRLAIGLVRLRITDKSAIQWQVNTLTAPILLDLANGVR